MNSAPWMKFYPSDWRADPALRMCSMAARGLWMEMLCLMHEAEPRGSLMIKSCALLPADLASICGAPVKETNRLLSELERAGVFSRDDAGIIYSRRMKRDTEKAAKDKANGKGGGNPSLKGGVNPPVNGEDKAQKPDTRYQKPEREKEGVANATDFAFVGNVGRLTSDQIAAWQKTYKPPNIMAELQAADDYYTEHPPKDGKWFFSFSSWLKREADRRRKGGAPPGTTPNPDGTFSRWAL